MGIVVPLSDACLLRGFPLFTRHVLVVSRAALAVEHPIEPDRHDERPGGVEDNAAFMASVPVVAAGV